MKSHSMKNEKSLWNLRWPLLVYAFLVAVSVLLGETEQKEWVLPLILLTILPGVWLIREIMVLLRGRDELQLRIKMDALSIAFGCAYLLLITEALLGIADVEPVAPAINLILVSVLLLASLAYSWYKYR